MVQRIILGFFPECAVNFFKVLQDGLRMAKDGPKDHPRIFPAWGVNFFKDAPGWSEDGQGWS